jgi:hypothetical protein
MGDEAALRVELLDHLERPVPGYSVVIRQNGFQTPVDFKSDTKLPERLRLRIVFEGPKRTDIRLSAVYVK